MAASFLCLGSHCARKFSCQTLTTPADIGRYYTLLNAEHVSITMEQFEKLGIPNLVKNFNTNPIAEGIIQYLIRARPSLEVVISTGFDLPVSHRKRKRKQDAGGEQQRQRKVTDNNNSQGRYSSIPVAS